MSDDEAFVVEQRPNAVSVAMTGAIGWAVVWAHPSAKRALGTGRTEAEAWADARRNMRQKAPTEVAEADKVQEDEG
jgi:hypothetical protein